ncbi:family 43 glycosylhydrolase [Asticcacaulis excentricus]|nr:family 43 glycosylhydrolase [Asticcacaulis excentricus]
MDAHLHQFADSFSPNRYPLQRKTLRYRPFHFNAMSYTIYKKALLKMGKHSRWERADMRSSQLFMTTAVALSVMGATTCWAGQMTVKVPATASAWEKSPNASMPQGTGDGQAPAKAEGLKLVAGQKILITATGEASTFPNGPRFGPDGQRDYVADDYPGGSGRLFPSKYADPDAFPIHLNELMGVFVDAGGKVVGRPFAVGKAWKGRVPDGARALQFGINDDVLADNEGAFDVVIEVPAMFPDADLIRAKPAPKPPVILPPYPQDLPEPLLLRPQYNPIISDGSRYSADPAPLVADGVFYILAGRDEAPEDGGGFQMMSWQMFVSSDPATKTWAVLPDLLRPEKIFGWAREDGAWASQIVQGPDKQFYLYAPIMEKDCGARDCFGIGVAKAPTPVGPWQDIHPEGPIISQKAPVRNSMQNIDPTVLVDDDGRVYIYWGTHGQLRGMELAADMKTPKGPPVDMRLQGFFEAPWIMKRKGVYYLHYAANNAGPASPCTEAVYHACQAYATSSNPLGPWTYRGVFLDPVSSATSHGGIVPFKDKWYMAYHNADAKGGTHFRRSVAIDEVQWDDSVSPPALKRVAQTRRPVDPTPTANLALTARITASNLPLPVQYRMRALNDGRTPLAPLPPDMWANWTGRNDAQRPWIQYQWDEPVTLNGSRLFFWGDRQTGSGEGVAPPSGWHLEYWTETEWKPVSATQSYIVKSGTFSDIQFKPVTTRCLRAVFDASTDGKSYAALGITEWEALSPDMIVPPQQAPRNQATPNCTK